MNPNYASFTDVTQGIHQDGWYWVKKAETVMESAKFKKPTPCLHLILEEAGTKRVDDVLSLAGSADTWDVNGKHFIPKKGATKIGGSQGVGRIITTVNESGFQWDMSRLEAEGWNLLTGNWFYCEWEDVVDRKTKEIQTNEAGYAIQTILLVKWGGNNPSAPNENAGGATTAPAAQAAAQPTDFPSAAVEAAVVAALTTAGGTMPVANVPTVVATTPPAGFDVAQHMPYVAPGSAWLTDAARPWTVVNGNLTKK